MISFSKDFINGIKWLSSIAIICGMALTTANIYPLNMYFHFTGVTGWLIVSIIWHDRSLIMLNSVAAFIFVAGIVSSLF